MFKNVLRCYFNILVDRGALFNYSQYCVFELISPERPVWGVVTHAGRCRRGVVLLWKFPGIQIYACFCCFLSELWYVNSEPWRIWKSSFKGVFLLQGTKCKLLFTSVQVECRRKNASQEKVLPANVYNYADKIIIKIKGSYRWNTCSLL